MLSSQFVLPIAREITVDLFAGGGGASTGIEQALGRHVDIAVNHDPQAISVHTMNHPQTRHFCSDVFEVDPVTVCEGQTVGLLWASPDCKHFSKAKGGKPVSKKVRGLAWVAVAWARAVRPRVICLENVEEFADWGPLDAHNMPDAARKGFTFRRWVRQLENLGYTVEHRILRACDYGAPTIRKRLFLVARCDGAPITWPEPTHAKVKSKGKKAYRTAAECIDWSDLGSSIFERKKELAPATQRRIAHGIKRYVIDAARPFIVPVKSWGGGGNDARSVDEPMRATTASKRGEFALVAPIVARIGQTGGNGKYANSVEQPVTTITTKAEHLLASATLIQTGYGERAGQAPRVPGLDKPLGTCVDGAKHALVAATLIKHYGGTPAAGKTHTTVESPLPTITASDHSSIAAATLVKLRGTSNSASVEDPLGTVTAGGNHHAAVYAFLVKYFGTDQDPRLEEPMHTATTKGRFALVTVDSEEYYIADIRLRMLKPRELFRAQGFPESYVFEHGAAGEPITKEAQTRLCGNSVPPPMSRMLVAANYAEQPLATRRAA